MWYILDKAKRKIGVMNTKAPNGLPILSDTRTEKIENGYTDLTFTIPSNHPKATLLQEEGFIIYTDGKIDFELYKIHEIEESYGDEVSQTVHCQAAATMELMRFNRIRNKKFTSATLETIMTFLSGNSGWRIGESFYNDLITIEFSGYPTAKDAIQSTIAQAGAEIEYKVVFDGNKIIDKVINLYEKRGKKTNVIIEYGLNLKGFTRKVNTEGMVTAMIGDGGGDANGRKISIIDAQWSPSEDGFEKLDDMIVDNNTLEEWFPEGIHSVGVFSDDKATNPVELAQNTLAELKKYNKPDITYEIDFAVLEDITGYSHLQFDLGDTIMIKDRTFSEPKFINARVIEKENSTTNPDEGKIVLAEYVLLKVDPIASMQKIQNAVIYKEKIWDISKAKADAALETVNEVKEQIVYKVEILSTNGTTFKNNSIASELYVTIFKGKDDITNQLPNSQITWTKLDKDGNLDTTWTNAHVNVGRTIAINNTDVQSRATFQCTVTIDDVVVATSQVTIADLNDTVISVNAPTNPPQDLLWVDINEEPAVLKIWNGTEWANQQLSLDQLDPAKSESIVDKNEVITSINQSNEGITINANKLNLTGYVTVTNLGTAGATIINGANIKTGTITWDKASGGTITLGGGVGNVNGELIVNDSNGDTAVELNTIEDDGITYSSGFQKLNAQAVYASETIKAPNLVESTTAPINYWVDPLNGNDSNEGSGWSSALATIQEAVDRLPKVLSHDVKITLHYDNAKEIMEQVLIQGFTGSGILTIDFQNSTNVVYGNLKFMYNTINIIINRGKIIGVDSMNPIYCEGSARVRLDYTICDSKGLSAYPIMISNGYGDLRNAEFYNGTNSCVLCGYGGRADIVNCKGGGSTYGLRAYRSGFIAGSGTYPKGNTNDFQEDEGGLINELKFTTSTVVAAPTTPAPATYTTVKLTSSSLNAWRPNNGGQWYNQNRVLQGKYSGYGRYMGYWFFGTGFNQFNGKTITKVRIYASRYNGGGSSASQNARFVCHGYQSVPSSVSQPTYYGGLSTTTAATSGFKWGESKWVDVTSAFKDAINQTSVYGIGLWVYADSPYMIFAKNITVEVTYKN